MQFLTYVIDELEKEGFKIYEYGALSPIKAFISCRQGAYFDMRVALNKIKEEIVCHVIVSTDGNCPVDNGIGWIPNRMFLQFQSIDHFISFISDVFGTSGAIDIQEEKIEQNIAWKGRVL